jgi:hypothetical protein
VHFWSSLLPLRMLRFCLSPIWRSYALGIHSAILLRNFLQMHGEHARPDKAGPMCGVCSICGTTRGDRRKSFGAGFCGRDFRIGGDAPITENVLLKSGGDTLGTSSVNIEAATKHCAIFAECAHRLLETDRAKVTRTLQSHGLYWRGQLGPKHLGLALQPVS